MVRPLLDSLIAEVTEILKRDGGCDKKSTRNTEWCNSYVTEEVLICNWQAFLAVQDSSIGDLVTHSLTESVSQVTFDFCDNDKTFERLLRDF